MQQDDELLGAGVAEANIPTLLCVLVQLTGNMQWFEPPYRPRPSRGFDDNDTGGLELGVQAQIRAAALEAILAWRAGRPMAFSRPDPGTLVAMLSAASGEEIPSEYGPMIAAQLEAADGPGAATEPHSGAATAIIVGAGFSGICAAVQLARAGISYLLLERNESMGGVWRENRYPGAGVDTPSHLYEFSFAPHDWPHYFATQAEVLSYLESTADRFGIREHAHFGTDVGAATFDPTAGEWVIDATGPDGTDRKYRARFVISAVGAFNRPKKPAIPGADRFTGAQFHTAEWPAGVKVTGQRVAVIGNGASAMQCVPAIVDEASTVTVFQRSTHWVAPFAKFHTPVSDPVRALMREVAPYRAWYRVRLGWTYNDRLHASLQRDPDWPHQTRSINAVNDRHREYFTRYIEQELKGRPDLVAAVLPSYPPYGKRILMDNGWYRALRREDVALVSEPIAQITEHAIETTSGATREIDTIVYATGFDVVHFLSTLEVRGRSGHTLADAWPDGDARAFLGLAVPEFPNFFILYGPNTQPGHGGSLIPAVEAQMDCIVGLLGQVRKSGARTIEVRRQAYEAYNQRVDAAHEAMVWTHPGMDTYYRNDAGRVVVNSPFRVVDFWHMTRAVERDDFELDASFDGDAVDLPVAIS